MGKFGLVSEISTPSFRILVYVNFPEFFNPLFLRIRDHGDKH